MTSLQEYLKALSFYLACLMTALLSQLQCFFCQGKLLTTTESLKQQLPDLEGFRDS